MSFRLRTAVVFSTLLASFALVACTSQESSATASPETKTDADAGAISDSDGGDSDAAIAADGGNDASGNATFVDARDDKSYRVLAFGDARWLGENLAFASPGSTCYGDAPECDDEGRLYPWSEAQTICPEGTHLATDDEWKALEKSLGMSDADLDLEGYSTARGTDEGAQLKDAAGFAAKMAGYRSGTQYDARGDRTYFWVGTTRGNDVWRRRISDADDTVFRFTNPPATFAISVRCVLD